MPLPRRRGRLHSPAPGPRGWPGLLAYRNPGEGEMKKRRALARIALAAAGVLTVASLATAASGEPDGAVAVADGARDAHQHGTAAGHLHPEGSHSNVDLISKLKLKNVVPEKIADVGVFKGYAYLASWGVVTCKYNGVHVVDVRDPANPKEAAFTSTTSRSRPARRRSSRGSAIRPFPARGRRMRTRSTASSPGMPVRRRT